YLSRRGLRSFHRLAAAERAALLDELLAPSYPRGAQWDAPLASNRFSVERHVNGAAQVICATGFLRGLGHDPLVSALGEDHAVGTVGRWIALAPDSTVAE